LNEQEREYLLPHFLMLLVGKPGSGKTTMIQHLLYDKGMYNRKFDKVLFISPSAAKSGLKIQQSCINEMFDMIWIFQKLQEVNTQQAKEIYAIMKANENQRMQDSQRVTLNNGAQLV